MSPRDHFIYCLGVSDPLSFFFNYAANKPHFGFPRIQLKGNSKGLDVLFPTQPGARIIATENTQPENMGIQLVPTSSQEHAVQKRQSHDSGHISTTKLWEDSLSLQGWGTWNYIPKCILPSPRLNEVLNSCSSIMLYSLVHSFWFFMQSLPFIQLSEEHAA